MLGSVYVDISRCIGCRACEVACEREQAGASHVTVVRAAGRPFAVPLLCRHCEQSPCATVCPTGALSLGSEGMVMLEADRCTGCSLCIFACPFGVISTGPGGVVDKCDLCHRRLEQGMAPVCVSTCPTAAISYEEYQTFTRGQRRRRALGLAKAMTAGPKREP